MRTPGSKNIPLFGTRSDIPTSNTLDVKHLSNITGSPLEVFKQTLNHQNRFIIWIEKRHEKIISLQTAIAGNLKKKGPRGAKEATYRKYKWYAEQLVLLEGINAFENFYKSTFTKLGTILRDYFQPPSDRVLHIKACDLWAIKDEKVVPDLVPKIAFENNIYHDLDMIDRCSELLIGERRYNQNSPNNPNKDRVRALKGVFQIRHTLSHNRGIVTNGDSKKFRLQNFSVKIGEVIDPGKESLSVSVFKELEDEASDYTKWLRVSTSTYLRNLILNKGAVIPKAKRKELEGLLGKCTVWDNVGWS